MAADVGNNHTLPSIIEIDVLWPPDCQYEVLYFFTEQLYYALQRQGALCRLLGKEKGQRSKMLGEILEHPPTCTLCFNGLVPNDNEAFLCDQLGIPHIAYLVDPPQDYFSFARSTHTFIATIDSGFCNFFRQIGCKNVCFLPHATHTVSNFSLENKKYDIAMLNSYIDWEEIRHSWGDKYPHPLHKILDECVEKTLSIPHATYYQSFFEGLEERAKRYGDVDLNAIPYQEMLRDLWRCIRGKYLIDILKNIHDLPVHIFGAHTSENNWKRAITNSNIIIHEEVPYMAAVDIMRHSKVLINSTPTYKHGAHERIFTAIASGCAVVTAENPYLAEQFSRGNGLYFYEYGKEGELSSLLHKCLSNDDARISELQRGRALVLHNHTWDNRAKELLATLENVWLKSIGKK